MAIKGKKKSQSRGSQGVRRPAQAPRPVASARRGPTPFYKTTDGKLIFGLLGIVLIGVIIWAVMGARNTAKEEQARADRIDHYTNEVRGVIQDIIVPAGEMSSIPTTVTPESLKDVKKNAERWKTSFIKAQSTLAQITPDAEVEKLQQLFGQGIVGLQAAADTYELVPRADGKLQADLLTRVAVQRDQGAGVIDAAIGELDRLRGDVDLSPSGLRSPLNAAPAAQPTIAPSPAASSGGGGGNGEGGKGDGGKKKNGGGGG
jgi:hypothetical protein